MAKYESRRSFLIKSVTATAGLSFGITALNSCGFGNFFKSDKIRLTKNGRIISINLSSLGKVNTVELRLYSSANYSIMEYSDESPNAPQAEHTKTGKVFDPEWGKKEEIDKMANRELRFPVVDIAIGNGMDAVAEIDLHEPGEYCFNGNFLPDMKPINKEIRIPAKEVEHWENAMLLDPKTNSIKSFYIASKIEVLDSMANFKFETLRDDWDGVVSIHDIETKKLIASSTIIWNEQLPVISTGNGVSRERMIASLSWALKYILECKNTKEDSPTFGGEYLLYDLDARCRLRSDWPWAWGPSARMFLKASSIEGVDAGIGNDQLKKRAIELGYASLNQQITDPSHPAYGIIKATIEPGTIRDCGFDNRATGADTLHLVGWGWMSLYKETKNPEFLEASKKAAEAIGNLMDDYNDKMIPQAYDLKKKEWGDTMFFETSMGMVGLAGLYKETREKKYGDIMIRFIDMLLNAFEREDGLWEANYKGKERLVDSCNYFTKSFGYCVDGLLAAHEAASDKGYLKRALKITEYVLKAQFTNGSWTVRLDRPAEEVGVDDKGTALWAYLFLWLYRLTDDKKYYNAGMKALEWCMDHQYFGEDPVARGGIVGRSWPSGIIYRHWFDIVCTYTVSFFGNALADALGLEEWK